MKALVKKAAGPGQVELLDVPLPAPGPGEVQIKIKYCGVCGTDLHVQNDEFPNLPPVILGHEFSGTVSAVGSEGSGQWHVGDRVVAECNTGSCGECDYCIGGQAYICYRKQPLGSKYNGAFAEHMVLPAHLLHPIPPEVPLGVAAMSEPFAVVSHGLTERRQSKAGETVLITGAATIGLMATIWACRLEARTIIVAGTRADTSIRLPLALDLGATRTVNVEEDDLAAIVGDATDGRGVDLWVECSGSGAAIAHGMESVKKTGDVVLIGLSGPAHVPLALNTVVLRELNLKGSYSATHACWQRTLAAEREEKRKLNRLVTEVVPLKEWTRAFEIARKGEGIKVLVDMEG
jgi:L-iditol 2-dehydrogenase